MLCTMKGKRCHNRWKTSSESLREIIEREIVGNTQYDRKIIAERQNMMMGCEPIIMFWTTRVVASELLLESSNLVNPSF